MVPCGPDVLACDSRCDEGRAAFRTVLSMLTISRLMQQIAGAGSRRRWPSSGRGSSAAGFNSAVDQ